MTRGALALAAVLTLLAGCGSSEESGPLNAEEATFIKNAETHTKTIVTTDPSVTKTVVSWKKDFPKGGLPDELYDPLLKKLDARDKAIQLWDAVDECPSVRLNDLCDLWFDALQDQSDWHNTLIKFIDSPSSQANLTALTDAGTRETKSLQQSKAEIDQIKQEAAE